MATKEQVAKIVQLRGLGYSLEEIGAKVGLSKSAVAYQLQLLKKKSQESQSEDVFASVILGGLAGVGGGLAIAALLELINKEN